VRSTDRRRHKFDDESVSFKHDEQYECAKWFVEYFWRSRIAASITSNFVSNYKS
jgi:hypothetical protein